MLDPVEMNSFSNLPKTGSTSPVKDEKKTELTALFSCDGLETYIAENVGDFEEKTTEMYERYGEENIWDILADNTGVVKINSKNATDIWVGAVNRNKYDNFDINTKNWEYGKLISGGKQTDEETGEEFQYFYYDYNGDGEYETRIAYDANGYLYEQSVSDGERCIVFRPDRSANPDKPADDRRDLLYAPEG